MNWLEKENIVGGREQLMPSAWFSSTAERFDCTVCLLRNEMPSLSGSLRDIQLRVWHFQGKKAARDLLLLESNFRTEALLPISITRTPLDCQ